MIAWYVESPDSGTHGAAGWALRQWGVSLPETLAGSADPPDRDWKVTPHGFTMVRITAGEFERTAGKIRQTVTLTRDLWLSDVEVTVGLFQEFINDESYEGLKPLGWEGVDESISPTAQHPVQQVSWEDAVLFCNWLSQREGRELCYQAERIPDVKSDDRVTLTVVLSRDANGYRLPTEAEWVYACRAGTTTDFGFGSDEERLKGYEVFRTYETEVVASKMCNRWRLFDAHGNVDEWWEDLNGSRLKNPTGPKDGSNRVYLGGSWSFYAGNARSGNRGRTSPRVRVSFVGFRVAQVARPAEKRVGEGESDSR